MLRNAISHVPKYTSQSLIGRTKDEALKCNIKKNQHNSTMLQFYSLQILIKKKTKKKNITLMSCLHCVSELPNLTDP